MRLKYLIFAAIAGCTAGGSYEKAENAQDAGREFIRATLEGDHKKAKFYLLKDTTNLLLIEKQQENYNHLSMDLSNSSHLISFVRDLSVMAQYFVFRSY
jgi:hypothetical protein